MSFISVEFRLSFVNLMLLLKLQMQWAAKFDWPVNQSGQAVGARFAQHRSGTQLRKAHKHFIFALRTILFEFQCSRLEMLCQSALDVTIERSIDRYSFPI